ncbi:MAG: phosphoribosylamine--glycine ligase [Alphaproteobacteria bacterium]
MKVLLLGGGGREHALAWAIAKSPKLNTLFVAPGNAGIAAVAQCVPLDHSDFAAIINFCQAEKITLVVVGPEAPLVAGLADALAKAGIAVFGPSRAAAQLEGSKGFTKELCRDHNIPTAAYGWFDAIDNAMAYLDAQPEARLVVKADGLAAGKGVVMCDDVAQAKSAVAEIFAGRFGAAGASVIIEEFLEGEEASFFVLVDGTKIVPLTSAQDHKRAFDGDTGPNTGGMGAYSPAPVMTLAMIRQTMETIIEPTVRALAAKDMPYCGVLYAGLMITPTGPKLIEYNVRFGDPETQCLMLRLKSDLLEALLATATGKLSGVDLQWHDDVALTVVMAASGYPGTYQQGSVIGGLNPAQAVPGVEIFHSGTAQGTGAARSAEKILSAGGRVLSVTALGAGVDQARARAYQAIEHIDWPGGFCRTDIGKPKITHGAPQKTGA